MVAPAPKAATLQRKVACLRSFYRYLRREGIMTNDPTADLHGPRKPQRLPEVLTRDEVIAPDHVRPPASLQLPFATARCSN